MKPRIAIVGIGGIFPGAPDLDGFWAAIRSGQSASADVPADRWWLDPEVAYRAGDPAPDRVYSRRACLLGDFRPDLDGLALDPEFLAGLDPVVHVALHGGRAALADASLDGVDPQRIGVIIGNIALPTDKSSELTREVLGPLLDAAARGGSPVFRPARTEPLNRHAAGLPAGVLARALGLGGGALALDAACASSLYAIKLAAEELLAGRADAMLTGGVSRPDCLYTQMGFSQLRALSPSGRCSPLDARADGLVVGEGGGFFVLKRVSDAIRAGDTIHAVIAGAGLSNDTGGNLLAPDVDGQLAAMRAAYAAAEWRPEDVDAIECHATGTAVGDRVEIESLHRLWEGRHRPGGKCVIGSVKSNVGHLLTGAGAAGVMKVLLALRHRVLPPTAHFERPAAGFDPATSPFEVLSDPRPWEERAGGAPRRAAVSAFGLGGINAHLLLEEWRPSPEPAHFAAPPRPPSVPVAVVGMAARYGPWEDLTAFRAHVFGGDDTRTRRRPRDFGLLASDAFRAAYPGIPAEGHFLDSLEIPLERFRIPPRELEETLPQQLLMLLAAADALRDAGAGDRLGPRAGVFVGLGLDPNAENFHLRWTLEREARTWDEARELDPEQNERRLAALRDASGPPLTANRTIGALAPIVASRIARRFRISGPSIALAGEETSGLRAIEAAVRALARDELDLVVAGAVDLTGDLRALLGRGGKRGEQGDPRPDPDSPALRSEGAGAVVLKRLEDARRDGDRIYAVVTGIGVAGGGGVERSGPEAPAVTRAIRAALAEAGPEAARIGHVEAGGTGLGEDDGAEAEALVESYGGSRTDRGPALGSVAATMGHAGAATGLAAFLRACLCLHHQTLPPLVRGARLRAELREAGFRSEAHARPWLRNRVEGPRHAAVSGIGMDGTTVHMVLEEAGDAATERTPRLEAALTTSEALFAVRADSVSALQASLERLDRMAAESVGEPVRRLASRWRETEDAGRGGSRGLAIVARHAEELRGLIARARAAIDSNPDAALPGPDSPEPAGNDRIFHAPVPLAGPEAVAFLYPGAGNHYPGMGERLAVRFPQILARQDRENRRLLDQFAPARGAGPSPGAHLGRDRNEALLAQVAHGSLVTDLLDAVGVRPRAAIGYSLGESAALFALRAWPNRDEMQRRLERSPLFDRDLGGECRAARSAWNLGPDERVDWVSGVVDRGPDAVRDALAGRDRAYLQVINTPEECVVGGARAAVESLVRELRCLFVPLEGVSTVHCPVLEPVIEAYEALHRLDATPPEGIRFYSGASGRAYAVTRESAARAIRSQAAGTLDFPAVIEQAWADGARIFIEVGPGSSTSRMARRILEGRPHLARALAPTGGDEVSGFVRLLAALVAAGMRIDDALVLGAARPVPRRRAGPSPSTSEADRSRRWNSRRPALPRPVRPRRRNLCPSSRVLRRPPRERPRPHPAGWRP
jgi:acyl transferase domain-containing protein